ncbi:MAG: DEAD/DEAH box helicase [Planctomycetota bacterium]
MTDKAKHPPLPEAFEKLGVRPSVLKGLAEAKFSEPSEIQALVIPEALKGVDILGQARTGTGKTAAFAIPLLQLAEPGVATQAIVLVPTRELCIQVVEEVERLGKHSDIRATATYGGERITAQEKRLKHHPEIIVGTPGRVIDLYKRRILDFHDVRFAVLDEVDRMFDIGFRDDMKYLLGKIRDDRKHIGNEHPLQTIFVSATIAGEVERLARRNMRDDKVVKLIAPGADDKPTVENVTQEYFSVEGWDKYQLLRKLFKREEPEMAIIFTRTKRTAEKIAKRMKEDDINVREIHGNLNQSQREKVMKQFRDGKVRALVATDLASRGIDVADVSHIINYDVPEDPEAYVHRIGRTARMGASGKAFTFIGKDQGDELTKIENLINMLIPQGQVEGFKATPEPRTNRSGRSARPEVETKPDPQPEEPKPKRRYAGRVARTRRRR